jgi:putative membrane protein
VTATCSERSPNVARFLASTALYLLANALGLLAAAYLLDGFTLRPLGFVVSVLIFTAVEALLGPFVLKVAVRYAPALRGGIALVTTFVGLLLTSVLTDGLRIEGAMTWLLAPFVVWAFVLVAAILLPMVLFKKVLRESRT